MTDRGEEEEELEGLEEIDVTDWAEDDKLLKRRFEEKTGCTDSQIEGWITSGKVSVRESHQETTAIVIKLNSGDGAVRFFQGGKDLGARQTYPGAKKKSVMVFLGVGHSFWLIRNASVKYITHDSKEVEGAQD
ncbi:hypothetical protein ABVK25_002990 [Lepraria finkii]|uniref:Uncharacterized protein n=1 Tax=Lepraria finkii TaxID=1340010 RepID=A0ABR4BID7_9LECA